MAFAWPPSGGQFYKQSGLNLSGQNLAVSPLWSFEFSSQQSPRRGGVRKDLTAIFFGVDSWSSLALLHGFHSNRRQTIVSTMARGFDHSCSLVFNRASEEPTSNQAV